MLVEGSTHGSPRSGVRASHMNSVQRSFDAPVPTSRILVLDDEPRITSFVSRALRSRGFQVDTAATIEEAGGLLEAHRYGLIVLDLRLPDGDGVDFLPVVVGQY